MNLFAEGLIPKVVIRCKLQDVLKFRNILVEQARHFEYPDQWKPSKNFEHELIRRITKPKYVKRYNVLPIEELCSKAVNTKKALEPKIFHPLHKIMGDEVREKIMNARFVVIFHLQPPTKEQFFDLKVHLNKLGLTYVYIRKVVIRLALQGTKYEPLLKLYESHCATFVSSENKFAQLLKAEKKFHFVSLIGGVYEGRIISVSDFKNLSSKPNIENHHSELSGLLTRHQQELSSSLQRYIADQSEKETSDK